jgi:hypothetical protein
LSPKKTLTSVQRVLPQNFVANYEPCREVDLDMYLYSNMYMTMDTTTTKLAKFHQFKTKLKVKKNNEWKCNLRDFITRSERK